MFPIYAMFVFKTATKDKDLNSSGGHPGARSRASIPLLKLRFIWKSQICVENFCPNTCMRCDLPVHVINTHDNMSSSDTSVLPELYEENAPILRKRRMAKTFGVEQIGPRLPVSVLVRKRSLENEDLRDLLRGDTKFAATNGGSGICACVGVTLTHFQD